jgi:hypothetical protein
LNGSVEENKTLLKNKYEEARVLGERANQSRGTISYLKNSIESIRRERALNGLSDLARDSKETDGNSETVEEEETYRRAIEQEKAVYKESFEALRVLKPEIEHVRKLLEKSRATMQNQFDQWFNSLYNRGGVILKSNPHSSMYNNTASSSSSNTTNNTSNMNNNHNNYPSSSSVSSSLESKQSYSKANTTISSLSSSVPYSLEADSKESSSYQQQRHTNNQHKHPALSTTTTGDSSSSSSDVNDDIMAFYQAKEELLKRRAQL